MSRPLQTNGLAAGAGSANLTPKSPPNSGEDFELRHGPGPGYRGHEMLVQRHRGLPVQVVLEGIRSMLTIAQPAKASGAPRQDC
jgi:hypothetical protein